MLFANPTHRAIKNGMRQGGSLSLKLFTACFEMVFCKMNWEDGVGINSEWHEMLQEINARSKEVDWNINASKTKVMQSFGISKDKYEHLSGPISK